MKILRIKLIAPRMSLRPMDSEFKRLMTPSISLLVLAALTPEEHDVEIIDENITPIQKYEKADLVGITCNIDTFVRAKVLSEKFQQTGTPVILGGIFPSSCPEIAERHATSVCIGEAEPIWSEILEDILTGNLKKRYYAPDDFPTELIPRPKWEIIAKEKYLYTNVITTSRGCPYNCEFCYNSCKYMTKKFRRRPIPSILHEISRIETKHILFVDDNFIGDNTWLQEFLNDIKHLNLTWHAAVSTDVSKDLSQLDKMKETGCRSLYIGFESLNPDSLSGVMKKQNRVPEYEQTIYEIHERGIMINASMVFGFDDDFPDVFENTLNWLVQNRIETMTAHILTPYPGTKLYARLEMEGRIIDRNFQNYNTSKVVYKPKNMTADELLNGYLNIYKEFYSFKNIIKRTPVTRIQWIPYYLFNFGYRKFGKLTSRFGINGHMSKIGRLARYLSYGI
jgi:radical SAM superfamily enzyme YgiQ (UPF0313 family)